MLSLDARLKAVGCVVIEGPKAIGKTATAARRAASEVRLDVDVNARETPEPILRWSWRVPLRG